MSPRRLRRHPPKGEVQRLCAHRTDVVLGKTDPSLGLMPISGNSSSGGFRRSSEHLRSSTRFPPICLQPRQTSFQGAGPCT